MCTVVSGTQYPEYRAIPGVLIEAPPTVYLCLYYTRWLRRLGSYLKMKTMSTLSDSPTIKRYVYIRLTNGITFKGSNQGWSSMPEIPTVVLHATDPNVLHATDLTGIHTGL